MDCSLSPHKSPGVAFNLKPRTAIRGFAPKLGVSFRTGRRFRALTVVAVAGAGHCEFSSLNSPLEPRTPAGKDLVSVLQNHPQLFKIAVDDELKLLADDRAGAIDRMILSADSPWACLHRYSLQGYLPPRWSDVSCYLKQIRVDDSLLEFLGGLHN